jgi:hypothetical protein
MINNTQPDQVKKQSPSTFDVLLKAWHDDQDVAWAELMAAWVEAPAAPRTPEVITRLIKRLDAK